MCIWDLFKVADDSLNIVLEVAGQTDQLKNMIYFINVSKFLRNKIPNTFQNLYQSGVRISNKNGTETAKNQMLLTYSRWA